MGIIGEHQRKGNPLTFERIDRAVWDLYGSWDRISSDTVDLVKSALDTPEVSTLYEKYRASESEAEAILLDFQETQPDQVRETDIASVLAMAKAKRDKETP